MYIDPELLSQMKDLVVLDENKNAIPFSNLWKEKQTAIVFIRHFGCAISRWQVAELSKRAEDFTAKNTRLAVIGNGEPDHIPRFREITGFHNPMYTDPDLNTFKKLNLKKNLRSMVGMKSIAVGLWSIGSGFGGVRVEGDALQQGGALVAGPGNEVRYYYRNKEAGDKPPVDEMLSICSS